MLEGPVSSLRWARRRHAPILVEIQGEVPGSYSCRPSPTGGIPANIRAGRGVRPPMTWPITALYSLPLPLVGQGPKFANGFLLIAGTLCKTLNLCILPLLSLIYTYMRSNFSTLCTFTL